MQRIPLVRSAAWWPVLPIVEALNVPIERHLASCGVPEDVLTTPDLFMSERVMWAFFEKLWKIEGIEDVGFRVGFGHGVLDVPGLAGPLAGRPTLKNLIEAFCHLLRGHASEWSFWLERGRNGVRFCRRPSPIDVGQWPIEQYSIGYMTDLVRLSAGQDWISEEIWLMADAESVNRVGEHLGGARVHHGSDLTALFIPNELLAQPVSIERTDGMTDFASIGMGVSLQSSIRMVLTSYLQTAPSIDRICEIVGCSPRTLQRRLAECGTTFREQLAVARFERARHLLKSTSISITEIAMETGYASLASFDKQFMKWSGVSPRAFRNKAELQ